MHRSKARVTARWPYAIAVARAGLVAACALFALSYDGTPAVAQTLPEALAATIQNNPTLRAAQARLRAVNEGVPQALSNWRPTVTASGSAGKARIDSHTDDEGTTPRSATLEVSQPLYRGGRTLADTERAENEVIAERYRLTGVEQDVLLRASTAYTDVWRDQSVLRLNISNEEVLRRQLEAAQDRFEVGEITRTDVAQSESRLAGATAARIAAEGVLNASRAVFREVTGLEPGALGPPTRLYSLPVGLNDVVTIATDANPDVQAASYSERAAQNQVRLVEGELLPSVAVVGSASHREETTSRESHSEGLQVLAEVTVPLYQRGAVSSRVRQAKQTANQRRIEVEETRRRIEQEATSAWEALLTARAAISSFEAQVRAAEIALEGVRQENAVGARTILDILDAEQELLDAQVNLVGARHDEIVAGYQVVSAIGRLTASDLDLAVPHYDPEADYKEVRDSWFGLDAPGVAD